jgi:glycolate oxidase
LGEEWVLPTGEVVRWGLVEEGKVGPPGPGYRGLCRGFFGVRGDLGIFTKCAVKLSPWPGPRELEITGRNPTPGIRIPKNMKAYHFALPGLGKFTEAAYKLADAAIAYHIWYFPLYYHLARWGGESNDDHYEGWKKFEAAGIIDRYKEEITIVIGAYSEKELKFKVEVLKDIMDETGAEELKLPGFTEHEAERFFCAQICAHKPCTQFRVGRGGQGSSWFQYLSLDGHVKGKKGIRQLYRKYVDKGAFNDYGMDTMWAGPEEGRSWGHSEYIAHTDQMKPELASELLNWTGETVSLAINERVLGTGLSSSAYHKYEPGEVEEKYLDNPAPYKVKIKKALDPNNVGDEISFYSDVRSKYRE